MSYKFVHIILCCGLAAYIFYFSNFYKGNVGPEGSVGVVGPFIGLIIFCSIVFLSALYFLFQGYRDLGHETPLALLNSTVLIGTLVLMLYLLQFAFGDFVEKHNVRATIGQLVAFLLILSPVFIPDSFLGRVGAHKLILLFVLFFSYVVYGFEQAVIHPYGQSAFMELLLKKIYLDKNQFSWDVEYGSAEKFPIFLISSEVQYESSMGGGRFEFDRLEKLYFETKWSESWQRSSLKNFKKLPNQIQLKWYSFSENQSYYMLLALPTEEIKKRFKSGEFDFIGAEPFAFRIGFGPKGFVCLWLVSSQNGYEYRVLLAQQNADQIPTHLNQMSQSETTLVQWRNEFLKSTYSQDQIKQATQLFEMQNRLYNWEIAFDTDDSQPIFDLVIKFANGEHQKFIYSKETISSRLRAVPEEISAKLTVNGKVLTLLAKCAIDELSGVFSEIKKVNSSAKITLKISENRDGSKEHPLQLTVISSRGETVLKSCNTYYFSKE